MKKNILVPVDYSDEARAGLKTALAIGRKIGAKVTVLHVVIDPILQHTWPKNDIYYMLDTTHKPNHFLSNTRKKLNLH